MRAKHLSMWLGGSRHNVGLALLTAVLFVAVAARYRQFASAAELRDTFDDTSILILLALGQMLVMLTRAIDLSVAASVALTGMCVALINQAMPGVALPWLVLCAVLLGAALGAVNGLLVWQLQIPPIVATLGTLAIYRGATYLVSHGRWVNSGDMSPLFLNLVRERWGGVTLLSWLAIAGVLLTACLLRYTPAGRSLYAAGNNPEAARYVGVDVGRAQCLAFVLNGALAGLCGYLWVARYAVAYTETASGSELTVIAACVIGGVSIAGGSGSVVGVLLGCLFLGMIKNALPLLAVSPFWQMAISGAVIVTAAVLNAAGARAPQRQRILEI
jgi:rhamnose transport system permease protein